MTQSTTNVQPTKALAVTEAVPTVSKPSVWMGRKVVLLTGLTIGLLALGTIGALSMLSGGHLILGALGAKVASIAGPIFMGEGFLGAIAARGAAICIDHKKEGQERVYRIQEEAALKHLESTLKAFLTYQKKTSGNPGLSTPEELINQIEASCLKHNQTIEDLEQELKKLETPDVLNLRSQINDLTDKSQQEQAEAIVRIRQDKRYQKYTAHQALAVRIKKAKSALKSGDEFVLSLVKNEQFKKDAEKLILALKDIHDHTSNNQGLTSDAIKVLREKMTEATRCYGALITQYAPKDRDGSADAAKIDSLGIAAFLITGSFKQLMDLGHRFEIYSETETHDSTEENYQTLADAISGTLDDVRFIFNKTSNIYTAITTLSEQAKTSESNALSDTPSGNSLSSTRSS